MANWLAALAGFGKAAQGLPEGLLQREKLDRDEARMGLERERFGEQTRQFNESQARQASQFQQQEDRLARGETTDVGPLYDVLGLPRPATASVSTKLTGPLATILGREKPKPIPVTENTTGFMDPRTGTVTPVPRQDPEPFTPPEGYVPSFTIDARGRRSTTYKPPVAPKPERTMSERFAAAEMRLRANPDDPQAQQEHRQAKLAFENEERLAGIRFAGRSGARMEEPLSPEEAGQLGETYGTTRREAAGKGKVPLLAAQRTKMDAQSSVLAMVDKMERDLTDVQQPAGPLDRILKAPSRAYGIYGQGDPKLSALHSRMEGTLALIVRALGEVGTLTDQDIKRARSLQPILAPIPDTAEVVSEKLKGLRELVQEVASRTGQRPGAAPSPQGAPAPAASAPGSGHDILRRANAVARERYGTAYGNLDEPTRRAIFQEVTGGR